MNDDSGLNKDTNLLDENQMKINEEKSNINNIESKLNSRNQFFSKNCDISDMRDQIQSNEVSLRKSTRNEEFDNRRRFTSVINDTSTSMKNFDNFGQEL